MNWLLRPRKNMICRKNMVRKNRLGKSINIEGGGGIFFVKMCVLCMFHVDWELRVRKKI